MDKFIAIFIPFEYVDLKQYPELNDLSSCFMCLQKKS